MLLWAHQEGHTADPVAAPAVVIASFPTPKTYINVANDIAAELALVSGMGQVHTGQRWLRDERRILDVYGAGDQRDAHGRTKLLGWTVGRTAIAEEPYSSSRNLQRETWTITGVASVGGDGSQGAFHALVDAAWQRFRALKTIAAYDGITAADTPVIAEAQLGGRLCWLAEFNIVGDCAITIPTLTEPLPESRYSTAGTREEWDMGASQIAAYLANVDGSGNVHAGKTWATEREEQILAYTVPAETDRVKRQIRSWQVFRETSEEERGLGQLVQCDTSWRIQGVRQWQDSAGSYEAFQAHIDDVCAKFRGLQNLGNTGNVTQSLSSPLQVDSIQGRSFMRTLCHVADCRIETRERVHA